MNPHQKNKVDIKSLSPEEQRLFRLYGKLPSKSDHFAKHLKERKYFDSGDYAMSKAGKGDSVDTATVGSQHPVPENIPHLSSPTQNNNNGQPAHLHLQPPQNGQAANNGVSPVKEGSSLQRENSADETEQDGEKTDEKKENIPSTESAPESQAIPRR